MKMAHAPPGHHSVIGRPSAGGLHFPEYVVYRGEQVNNKYFQNHTSILTQNSLQSVQAYPEYLVTYQIMKPEDSSSGNEDTAR